MKHILVTLTLVEHYRAEEKCNKSEQKNYLKTHHLEFPSSRSLEGRIIPPAESFKSLISSSVKLCFDAWCLAVFSSSTAQL